MGRQVPQRNEEFHQIRFVQIKTYAWALINPQSRLYSVKYNKYNNNNSNIIIETPYNHAY